MPKPLVYIASKMPHAAKWQALRKEWKPRISIISSWFDKYGTVADTPENAEEFWTVDVIEVSLSDFLVCYAEPEDHLRGALVEVGVMLGKNGYVIVVGEHPDYGTWQYHPNVHRVATLDDAKLQILVLWSKNAPDPDC